MNEDFDARGWDAVQQTFDALYPGQENPLHFGVLIPWQLGGPDPLQGISVYDGGDFYHFVTFGFSELYEKESEDEEYSGFGFELTLKLKKGFPGDEDENQRLSELQCVAGNLQSLARYVFESGNVFQPYEYIYTGQQKGMDRNQVSKLTGFVTLPDPAGVIHTPNGKVEFVQLVGMTDKELRSIHEKKRRVKELLELLGHSLTDYRREDLI